MRKRGLLVVLLIVSIFLSNVLAQEEVATLEPGLTGATSQIAESLKQQQINELFKAFDNKDATTAVQILAANPDFWQLGGVPEAFANAITEKPVETAEALNSDNGVTLLAENQEVQDAYAEQASKDPAVLNVAPKAKATLFKEKHDVTLENNEVEVTDYDDLAGVIETEVKYSYKPGDPFYDEFAAENPYFTDRSRVTADSEKYDQGSIRINPHGYTVFEPNPELEQFDLPETDTLTIAIPEGESLLYIDDKDTEIRDEFGNPVYFNTHRIKGTVHVDQGQVIIWNQPATINEVQINPNEEKQGVNLYFDGQAHGGVYASMNNQERVMKFGRDYYDEGGFSVNFEPGNPYLETGYVRMGPLLVDTDVTVMHRGSEKIPLVTIEQKGDIPAGMDLINGHQKYEISTELSEGKERGVVKYRGVDLFQKEKGSALFTLIITGREGQNILGTEKEKQKIVYDEKQNFVVLPEESEEKFERKNSRAVYEQLRGEVQKKYGISLTGGEEDISFVIDALEKMAPSVREGIRGINILTREEMDEVCGSAAFGCTDQVTKTISIQDIRSGKFGYLQSTPKGILHHEATHAKIRTEESNLAAYKAWAQEHRIMSNFYGEDYRSYIEGSGSEAKLSEEHRTYLKDSGYDLGYIQKFEEDVTKVSRLLESYDQERSRLGTNKAQWGAVAGSVYATEKGEEKLAEREQWRKEPETPRAGCINFYSCTNYDEDRAEFNRYATTFDPAFFIPLIAPPGHSQHDPQQYDLRYRQKLDLLLKFGDISPETYDNIINAAEGKKESSS